MASNMPPNMLPVMSRSDTVRYNLQSDDMSIIKITNRNKISIYTAYSKSQKQYLTLKLYPFQNYTMSPDFEQEARFAWLNHPNIQRILHVREKQKVLKAQKYEDVSYVLTDLAPYGNVANPALASLLMKDQKLVRTYFSELVEAIGYLHKSRVSHLDIQPENLLIGKDFSLKLAEFSSAVEDDEVEACEVDYSRLGSTNFRAPEIQKNDVQCAKKADVYSMGVTLYIMLFGQLPFGEEEAKESTLSFANQVDPAVTKLISAMLSQNPNERPSVDEIKKNSWVTGSKYSTEEKVELLQASIDESNELIA